MCQDLVHWLDGMEWQMHDGSAMQLFKTRAENMLEFAGDAGQIVTCDCKLEALQSCQHKFIKIGDYRSKQYVQLRIV